MTKEKAIKLFQFQRDKINSVDIDSKHDFANSIKDLIIKFIDPDSKHLKSFEGYGIFWFTENLEKDKKRMLYIIDDCIEKIKELGIYKTPTSKINFLGNIDNNTLWGIISFIIVALPTAGFYIGKYHERSELLFNHITTNSNTISTTDTTANNKNNNIGDNVIKHKVDSISNDK